MNFKEFLDEKKTVFEITDTLNMTRKEAENIISKHYSDKLTYKGTEFFNKIYMGLIIDEADTELNIGSDGGQESYLGYLPKEDIFVSGWDTWEPEDDFGDSSGDGVEGNVAYIKISASGRAKTEKVVGGAGDMMYTKNNTYKNLHKKHKDLIDIRLD